MNATMNDIIYLDHSILSTYGTCHEKGRLAYVEDLQPKGGRPPLVFGSAFHAAIESYYTSVSLHKEYNECVKTARAAFLQEVRKNPDSLPLSASSDEKRSIERGLYLIDAYCERWKSYDKNWEDVFDPISGKPYIEIGFAVFLMEWKNIPVMYVGKVDRVRRYRIDGQLYNWETKTTGGSLYYYKEMVRPNHQITGYKWALQEYIKLNIAGTLLDAIHISDRKVDGKFPNGIDIDKDFYRGETRRSQTDVEEFLFDLRAIASEYLRDLYGGAKRWHRDAPSACNMFGGCHFRNICSSNLNPTIIDMQYRKEKWAPWIDLIKEPTKLTQPI